MYDETDTIKSDINYKLIMALILMDEARTLLLQESMRLHRIAVQGLDDSAEHQSNTLRNDADAVFSAYKSAKNHLQGTIDNLKKR